MSELRIPIGKYARRVFWTVVVGSCLLLVAIMFLALPLAFGENVDLQETLGQIFGDILATVLAATVLSGAIVWLTRPSKRPTDLQVLHPRDIRPVLEQNLKDTRSWMYSGSAGRWNRARVLPEMAARARASNLSHAVVLCILDPREREACSAYATYRSGLRSGHGEDWSLTRVRCDLLATIVKAAVLADENPLLEVRIALKRSSSVLRIDVSDKQLVVTREDPNEPGILCDHGSYFYDAFRQELEFAQRQARILSFSPRNGELAELTSDKVRELLKELDLEQGLDESELESITRLALSDAHPYG